MPGLPARPSLEHLRKQAKRHRRRHGVTLSQAQREIARGYGFASWPRLARHVAAASLEGWERALRIADPAAVEALLAHDGGDATGTVAGAPPLIALLRDSVGAPSDVRACAVLLLGAGADPSATVPSEDGEWDLTVSYFAVQRDDATLLRAVVDAGAAPDDDAFYHACEHGGAAFLEPLYRPGYETMINHKLDFEDPVGLRWILDRGVDVNEHASLHWAIGRGRSVRVLRMLVEAGADVDLPHPDVGLRPLAAAARCAHLEAYDLLVSLGASADLDDTSAAMLAVARGESTGLPDAPPPLPGYPTSDPAWVIGQLAQLGRTGVVRSLLDTGVPVDTRCWSGFTPLDLATMAGRLDVVRLLVDRGADLTDTAFDDDGPTPLDCAVWGWQNSRLDGGEYEEVVRLLVDAGAPTQHEPPTGNAVIDRLLERRP